MSLIELISFTKYFFKIFQMHKSEEQKETLANISRLFNARENIIQLPNDYTKIATGARL